MPRHAERAPKPRKDMSYRQSYVCCSLHHVNSIKKNFLTKKKYPQLSGRYGGGDCSWSVVFSPTIKESENPNSLYYKGLSEMHPGSSGDWERYITPNCRRCAELSAPEILQPWRREASRQGQDIIILTIYTI